MKSRQRSNRPEKWGKWRLLRTFTDRGWVGFQTRAVLSPIVPLNPTPN